MGARAAPRPGAPRAWAPRLFALGSASLLYRVEYGLWALAHGGALAGHQLDWQGPLDLVMDFFSYVRTLAVCEVYLRARRPRATVTLLAVVVVAIRPLRPGCPLPSLPGPGGPDCSAVISSS